MGAGYQAEVFLRHQETEPEEGLTLLVEGRADGIFEEDGQWYIDEIKGMYADVARFLEPFPLHLAQAMCYGYFYCCDHELEQIGIQLTYCSLETEEIKRFRSQHTRAELCQWFQGVIGEYFKWARYQYRHRESRDQSIRGLEFPFPYGRARGIWSYQFTALFPGKSGCLSKLLRGLERRFPLFSRR